MNFHTSITQQTAILQVKLVNLCLEDFVEAKFHCRDATAHRNHHIWIREKTLKFSMTLLVTSRTPKD